MSTWAPVVFFWSYVRITLSTFNSIGDRENRWISTSCSSKTTNYSQSVDIGNRLFF